jgi:hypothetical protein
VVTRKLSNLNRAAMATFLEATDLFWNDIDVLLKNLSGSGYLELPGRLNLELLYFEL